MTAFIPDIEYKHQRHLTKQAYINFGSYIYMKQTIQNFVTDMHCVYMLLVLNV